MGRRPEVAAGLADADVSVAWTDVVDRDVPPDVTFVRDDPGDAYHTELVYGLNLPPELHRPALRVAGVVDAEFLFTTLGSDPPVVQCDVESIADGETLYVARGTDRRSDR